MCEMCLVLENIFILLEKKLEYAWELRIIAFKKKRVLVTRESGLAGGTETLHWEKKQPEDKNC